MRVHPEIASFIGIDEIIDFDFDKFFGICPGCNKNLVHYDSENKQSFKAVYCSSTYKTCKLLVSIKNFDKFSQIKDYFCRLDLKIITNLSTYAATDVTIDYVNDTITVNKMEFPRESIDIRDVDSALQKINFWNTFS